MAKVLVVDDEMDIRFFHRALLESAGHEVTEAVHGEAALHEAQLVHPDLIITDLMMPVMTGDKFIEALRALPDLAETPVILVSASPGKPKEAGADVVFRKPVDNAKLLAAVVRLTASAQQAS